MSFLLSAAARFAREEDAPTMVEYGILLAAVVVVVGMSGHMLGQVCGEIFRDVSNVASASSREDRHSRLDSRERAGKSAARPLARP